MIGSSFFLMLAIGLPIRFEEVPRALPAQHRSGVPEKRLLLETMGGGLACADLDGDNDIDLILTGGAGSTESMSPPDTIYWNEGGRKFTKGPELPGPDGWSMGVTAADYDGDGDLDLYVTNFGSNRLLRNDGEGRFTDVTEAAGADDERWSMSSAWADYDLDGDLDLFVANYVAVEAATHPEKYKDAIPWRGLKVAVGPGGLPGAGDSLFRNNGDGTFDRVEEQAGVADARGRYGFQAIFMDLTGDGLPDLFVANDSTPNFFYRNKGNGQFKEEGIRAGVAYSLDGEAQAGMGACVGDPDSDGDLDLVVTNFSNDYNAFYRNEGSGFFEDATAEIGLRGATWSYLSWGCAFSDFDGDGAEDLFIANGHIYPQVDAANFNTKYRQKDQVFRYDGKQLAEVKDSGLQHESLSRGACVADFDADGREDLAIGVLDDSPTVLWNDSETPGKPLRIRLQGSTQNRHAIGARVLVGGRARAVLAGESFLGSRSTDLLFHVTGREESPVPVTVVWPGGRETTHRVDRGDGVAILREKQETP